MLLQNPDIVVLDEATSALDVETKASVQEAINKEFPGKTIMSIEWVLQQKPFAPHSKSTI